MVQIQSFLQSMGSDMPLVLKALGILLGSMIILALLGRFIFGKASLLTAAVSSSIVIVFIYIAVIVIEQTAPALSALISPLPFLTVGSQSLQLFSFSSADHAVICSQLLDMVILSFLVNLADRWIPRGKHFLSWIIFRLLTVFVSLIMYVVVNRLLNVLLPAQLQTYAPMVLLGVLVLLLATGCLKFIISVFLATVNPLIGALYGFFFANIIGKQITRAVLTTAILTACCFVLEQCSILTIAYASVSLYIVIPLILLLLGLWYLMGSASKK